LINIGVLFLLVLNHHYLDIFHHGLLEADFNIP
jgi:hypothetical protein